MWSIRVRIPWKMRANLPNAQLPRRSRCARVSKSAETTAGLAAAGVASFCEIRPDTRLSCQQKANPVVKIEKGSMQWCRLICLD